MKQIYTRNEAGEDKFTELGKEISHTFALRILKSLEKEIQLKNAEEINIARQEGQPTSRLTSLWMKIDALITSYKESLLNEVK